MRVVTHRLGRGPHLVLIPGWAFSAAAMLVWARRLAVHWRVHVVELPGHGGAPDRDFDAEGLAADIAAEVRGPALWTGWSLGGQIAVAAARAGYNVRALVLVAATPRFTRGPGWCHGLPASRLAAMRVALAEDPSATLRRFLSLLAERGAGSRRAVAQLGSGCGGGRHALAAGLRLLAETDLRAALPKIATPTLWIGGDADPLVPAAALRVAADSMPAGQHVIIDGAGHLPFLTHGAAVDTMLARQALASSASAT